MEKELVMGVGHGSDLTDSFCSSAAIEGSPGASINGLADGPDGTIEQQDMGNVGVNRQHHHHAPASVSDPSMVAIE